MKQTKFILLMAVILMMSSCKFPAPEKKKNDLRTKHNYIILLDLSDRLIVQDRQPQRDKQIIEHLYTLFEQKVKKELYVKSRDEIRVVIAPQRGAGLNRNVFEDKLYVNMDGMDAISRKAKEEQRRADFSAHLDTLYQKAVFSHRPEDYHGADIWKYFYEDLKVDYSHDTLTQNYLFILTDGYPIVGQQNKLLSVKNEFPDLEIVLLEAAPRERDLEWDHLMGMWEEWFNTMGIKNYTLVKRSSITKELEQLKTTIDRGDGKQSVSKSPVAVLTK